MRPTKNSRRSLSRKPKRRVLQALRATGRSVVHETVYQNRFGYTETLNQMGANIELYAESLKKINSKFGKRNYTQSAIINGPTPLHGADITVPDLRAGFSYIIAALVAEGESTIRNTSILYRGYERLEEKLTDLGVELLPGDPA
jgi:UDP-N-acetylglucosamine 1-carboxyvinyltransferase